MNDKFEVENNITITPNLNDYDRFYLLNFYYTYHFHRDPKELQSIYNGRNGYNGEYGKYGEFFIRMLVDYNGRKLPYESDGIDYNNDEKTIVTTKHPYTLPSTKCPWLTNKDGSRLLLSNIKIEKNYQWLVWLIDNFFSKKDYKLNGNVKIFMDKNIREIKLDNNGITYSMRFNNKYKKEPIRKLLNNEEIINKLIDIINDKNIIWKTYKNKGEVYKYSLSVSIKKNLHLDFNLYYRNKYSTNNFINIYIRRNDENRLYKTIKNNGIEILINKLENKYDKKTKK